MDVSNSALRHSQKTLYYEYMRITAGDFFLRAALYRAGVFYRFTEKFLTEGVANWKCTECKLVILTIPEQIKLYLIWRYSENRVAAFSEFFKRMAVLLNYNLKIDIR